nr:hypothetical protein [uncultured Sphaerochaeta sp.]
MKSLTGAQLRAARALIRITAQELADSALVGVATVRRAEGDDGPVSITEANAVALRRALEAAGVEFIEQNGGGAGVRLSRVYWYKTKEGELPEPHNIVLINLKIGKQEMQPAIFDADKRVWRRVADDHKTIVEEIPEERVSIWTPHPIDLEIRLHKDD